MLIMKNWDYYRAPNIEYFGYEQSKEYRDRLVYEIAKNGWEACINSRQ